VGRWEPLRALSRSDWGHLSVMSGSAILAVDRGAVAEGLVAAGRQRKAGLPE